ncbi:RES family NAD+ phosphorylase [Glaciibacter superstes]|uniref:RES family NAD+ phosphorylase n=1 Tax=Glaciibacter superstes TaxID=501023 RepID=UPI000A05D3D6
MVGFPENRPSAGALAFKAHKATRQPGYFAPRPPSTGRFSVPDPLGACYLAATPGVAVGELISPVYIDAGYVPASAVEGVVITAVMLPEALCFANVSDPAAKPWRVTTELTSTDDCDIPRQWAVRFAAEGYDGVFYTARFSPGGRTPGHGSVRQVASTSARTPPKRPGKRASHPDFKFSTLRRRWPHGARCHRRSTEKESESSRAVSRAFHK